jgi:hypothetical protein
MIRLALVVLAVGPLVGPAGALAPAPFPRDRKGDKATGNEANERKLREAIRLRRNDEVTITLPVGATWKLLRAVAEGDGGRLSVGFTLRGSGLSLSGAADGWDISGRQEGEAKLVLHFRDRQEQSAFTVVVRLVLVKLKTPPTR